MYKSYLSVQKNIKINIIPIYLIVSLCFLLLVKDLYSSDNFSNSKNIPEIKKQTVFFGKSKSPSALQLQQPDENNLTMLQKQARMYRAQGLEAQARGNLETAMIYYQKAIELDPAYVIAYNDLGIIYEANGQIDRSEESYLKAIKIDPNYLSSYSNLALLYENKRDLKNAYLYWQKRAELGTSDDPWTLKARSRCEDIALILGEKSIDSREEEVLDLVKDVSQEKAFLRKDNKELSKYYFEKAKLNFQKSNNLIALQEALRAHQLDPSNETINEFIEKLETRLLSK